MRLPNPLQHSGLRNFQHKILLNLPYWLGAALVALISVGYNVLFKLSEELALRFAHSPMIFFLPPCGLLISFLIGHFVSREAIGSGIPQVIAAVEAAESRPALLDRLLSLRMLVAKVLGSCVAVLGGGVVGREGPTLQISAAVFYQIAKIWPESFPKPRLSPMILAGGAAGLASAFNTPLGGIVFAIEELSKFHISLVRTAVFQAVLIAGILAQIFLGNYLYLGSTDFGVFPWYVLYQVAFIAGIVGLCGGFFAEGLYQVTSWRKKKSFSFQILMTVFCGVLISLTIWMSGSMALGGGKHVLTEVLSNPMVENSASLPLARILGSFFSYIGGAVGGIFAPALASGATLGQLLGQELGYANIKLMMMVGMVAFLTGITRSPFTSFVLVLEMSNSHEIILYLMLASLVSNVTARLASGKSFYEKVAHNLLNSSDSR